MRRTEERVWTEESFRAEGEGKTWDGRARAKRVGGLFTEIGQKVTNEPILCENASTSKVLKSVQVTANSDEVLGLDKLETKPAEVATRVGQSASLRPRHADASLSSLSPRSRRWSLGRIALLQSFVSL